MNALTGRSVIPTLVSLLLAASVVPPQLGAATRTTASGDYSITTESSDSGGGQLTGGPGDIYRVESSIGGVAGFSVAASPAITLSGGYTSQLPNVTGLMLTASGASLNEAATLQLSAFQVLDDATFLAIPAASVAWNVQSGPLTGISTSGVATADIVFQDTAATAQGVFSGDTDTLGLTVKNVNPDDFGSYAGDGIDDGWQNQYFGLDNPNAAPNVDFNGTGQTNLFKYIAGLNPLDPNSRFTLTVQPMAGQPTQKKLLFAPLADGRTYTVKFKTDLTAGTWTTLPGATFADNGLERTVTDPTATEPRKFYRVEITKP